MKRDLLIRLVIVLLAMVTSGPAGAVTLASDSAADASFDDGWQEGDGAASGWTGGWMLAQSSGNGSENGFFIGDSTTNGDGDGNGDGDVNTAGRAWAMYANSGQLAEARRVFAKPLQGGDRLTLELDNGDIANGSVGVSLESAGQPIWEFYFIGGTSFYRVNDAAGERETTLNFTDEGLRLEFTRVGWTSYSLTAARIDGTATDTLTGALKNLGGGQVIDTVRLFNFDAGSGGARDAYFNSMVQVDDAPPTLVGVTLLDGAVTNTDTVRFRIEYSEDLSTLTEANIGVTATGSIGGTIASISGGPRVWDVAVDVAPVDFDGTIGLVLLVVTDTEGHASVDFGPTAVYTIDNTPPSVALGAPLPATTSVGPVSHLVTYTDAETITLSADDLGLIASGSATGTLTVLGDGPTTRLAVVNGIAGSGTLLLTLEPGTSRDLAGNMDPAPAPTTVHFDVDGSRLLAWDYAWQPAYDDGWQTGDDGGEGWGGGWWLSSTAPAGHLVTTSRINGDDDSDADGDIDTDGRAWAMFANNDGMADAVRPLGQPMQVGDKLLLRMDNGFIDLGGTVGFGLRNASGENLFEFIFANGQSRYQIIDGNGVSDLIWGFSDEGFAVELTLTGPASYDVRIEHLLDGSVETRNGAPLMNPSGGQAIEQVRLFNVNAGVSENNDATFNSLVWLGERRVNHARLWTVYEE